nr:hypothetical protein Iba_chr09aCG2820 [Ipomoea batatas]GMD38378.1 hypothetical protein Iba_chr09fCG3380 [Ipomoea batatas]
MLYRSFKHKVHDTKPTPYSNGQTSCLLLLKVASMPDLHEKGHGLCEALDIRQKIPVVLLCQLFGLPLALWETLCRT